MSIQSEITRITNRRDQSLAAVAAKGVTVPVDSTLDDLPGLIALIEQSSGSGGVYQDQDGYIVISEDGEGSGSAIGITDTEDSHGGTIREITAVSLAGDTVTPATLGLGVTAHDRTGAAIVGTADIPGTGPEPLDVNFIDYDGRLLHAYTATEFSSMEELPSNPTHEGLTAQGWNWTLADIKSQLQAVGGPVWVGQMYITDDGKTRIYINLDYVRLHPYLGICPNGSVTVDWGDNSSTDTLSGTSLTTVQVVDHVYAEAGDYVITLTVLNGSFRLSGGTGFPYILRKNTTDGSTSHKPYTYRINKIELGENVTMSNYAFVSCDGIKTVTVPNGALISTTATPVTNVLGQVGQLQSFVIPHGVTEIGGYSFSSNTSMKSISIPNGVITIGNFAFSSNTHLESVTLPASLKVINSYAFSGCHNIKKITIPAGVNTINSSAFGNCYRITEYHLLPETPPTLSSSTALEAGTCIIYVPYSADHSILEAYKTATNWSTYASQMQEEAI